MLRRSLTLVVFALYVAAVVFAAEAKTVQLQLEGVHCAGCSGTIIGAVDALPGTDGAVIDITTGLILVTYDPQQVTPQQIEEQIRSTGYGATLVKDSATR